MTSHEVGKTNRPTGPWRDDHDGMVGRRRRRVRRFVFTAALAAAIIAFGLWLAGPFRAPQGYVVTAYAAFDATQTVPSLFTPIDEDNWRAISETHSLSPRSPIELTLDGLRAQLRDIAEVSSSQDRVIVSLTSHGIAKDQHAFLLGDRFQPVLEESMLVSVSEILDAVRAMPGRTKIIIIDAGQIIQSICSFKPFLVRKVKRPNS